MVNIITVKWGNKYSSNDVNNLYKMVKKNVTIPFTFYCITENPTDLQPDIFIIHNDLSQDLDGVWNKLLMFKPDFLPSGTKLYLDIDTVIQNNLDELISNVSDKLTMVQCYWKEFERDKDRDPTTRNSSVLLWKDDLSYIWDKFIENPDYYMTVHLGIDRWMEKQQISVDYFKEGLIYSRMYGKDLNENEPSCYVLRRKGVWEWAYHFPEYLICLFNGDVLDAHYDEFEDYF